MCGRESLVLRAIPRTVAWPSVVIPMVLGALFVIQGLMHIFRASSPRIGAALVVAGTCTLVSAALRLVTNARSRRLRRKLRGGGLPHLHQVPL